MKQFFAKRQFLFRFAGWFFVCNSILFWLIGARYLITTLSSKTLFSTSFYVYHSTLGKAFVILFACMSFISHLALLALLPASIILLFILFINRRDIVIAATIFVGTLSVITLLIDSIVFANYHFHLNMTILTIMFSRQYHVISFFELSQQEVMLLLLIASVILCIEALLATAIYKLLAVNWLAYGKRIGYSLLTLLSFSYILFILSISANSAVFNNVLAQQTPNLPLFNDIVALLLPFKESNAVLDRYSETHFSQPLFAQSPLHYPLHPLVCHKAEHPYNIVMIGIDTWRFDALNTAMTPVIQRFAKEGWEFRQHASGGNSTQAGLFSLFYGLPSSYWTSMLKQHTGSLLLHELLQQQYQVKILFSSDIGTPPFDQTIFQEVTGLKSFVALGNTSAGRDQLMTHTFKQFMQTRNPKQPFFAFLFYDTAHNYCQDPNIPTLYPTMSPTCQRIAVDKNDQRDYLNHYKNAVHFVDHEIGDVLATLKASGDLAHTIVIITGDHGEEFNDSQQNYWGHASNFTRYQVGTPLVIYWPGKKPAVFSHQTSHYDVAPFLMQQVMHCDNPTTDYSLAAGLLNREPRPYLLVGSYINMGILEKNLNMTLMTSGSIRIADRNAQEIPHATPDPLIVAHALHDMRKYYRQ